MPIASALAAVALLLSGAGACGSAAAPPGAPPPTAQDSATPTVPPSRPAAVSLRLQRVAFSWGSTGVVAASGPVPYWTIGIVDAEAPTGVQDLRLDRVDVLDAAGRTLASARTELELRVAPTDRSTQDLSAFGTEPLQGGIPAGRTLRLWVHARLPDGFAPTATAAPARFGAVLIVDGDHVFELEGALDPQWPTG